MQTGERTGGDFGASQKALTTYFTQKEDASIASVDAFKDMAKDKADVRLFTSANAALATVPMLGMSKASDLLKDIYSASTINFEDGKVVMDSKAYTNQIAADTLKKYAGPKVDVDMLDHYPGAVNGFALFSFDPKLLASIINTAGATATINQNLQPLGFTIDDVTRAFKGDFAVIFSNFGVKKYNTPDGQGETTTAKIIFNAAIGDKAAYDRIVQGLAAKNLMVQQNGQYVFKEMVENPSGGFVMNTDNKNLLIASDAALLQQYKSGTGKVTLPQGIGDKAKGNAVVFYADIASMLNAMPPDTTDQVLMNSAKQTFRDAIATTENISGNVLKGHLEVRMMNEKENSLAALARYFGTLSAAMDQAKEAGGMNSTMMIPDEPDDSTGAGAPRRAPGK